MKAPLSALLLLLVSLPAAALDITSDDCLILPGESVDVGGTIPGQLSFVIVDVGDVVEKGQVIASLRSEIQESVLKLARLRASNSAAVGAAEARLAYDTRELERARDLQDRGVLSDANVEERQTSFDIRLKELEEAEMELQMSKLDLERAEAELEIRRIRSPISGFVADRILDGGEYLRDDSKVVTIISLDPLRVEVFLDQKVFNDVTIGQDAKVFPELLAEGHRIAQVLTKDVSVDAASATFRVRLSLANTDNDIVSGIRCRVEF